MGLVGISLFVVGCGGSNAPTANCKPAMYAACKPLTARGCALFEASDGSVVYAAICSGEGATVGCLPEAHLACAPAADCDQPDCAAP